LFLNEQLKLYFFVDDGNKREVIQLINIR